MFRKFLSRWAFFQYSQWSNNDVIVTILQYFCICECETQQKLNFFQKLKIFLLKLKEVSAQNSIILAKLNFSEIPFPYDGAKTAKKTCLIKNPATDFFLSWCWFEPFDFFELINL